MRNQEKYERGEKITRRNHVETPRKDPFNCTV